MKWILDFIKAIAALMPWRGGGVDGYDRLADRLERRLENAEGKLDTAITKLHHCEGERVVDGRRIRELENKVNGLEQQ